METKREQVAKVLLEARTERGWSRETTAMHAGLHPTTVYTAERAGIVTLRTARRLGEALGLDPDDIVTRD